jgi:hypothetical protein
MQWSKMHNCEPNVTALAATHLSNAMLYIGWKPTSRSARTPKHPTTGFWLGGFDKLQYRSLNFERYILACHVTSCFLVHQCFEGKIA